MNDTVQLVTGGGEHGFRGAGGGEGDQSVKGMPGDDSLL